MKLSIDTDEKVIHLKDRDREETCPLYSKRSLELISEVWLKVEWNEMHWQSFTWMGVPIWQLPEDLLRIQEVICDLKPDVIVETGVCAGGSAIFFASLCRLIGKGRVISIDITIPNEVRDRIDRHPLGEYVTLIEGNSVDEATLRKVRAGISLSDTVLVFLDSDHSKNHVLAELQAFKDVVTVGSYMVAADGVMQILHDTPCGNPVWTVNNPAAAAREFVADDTNFIIHRPPAKTGDERQILNLTYWPDAWVRRVS